MIKTPDLVSYLPNILQTGKEVQAITNAENPEFQSVFDTSELVLNNVFIQTGDMDGIKRYEKILKIKPSENDTLETRRFRVLSRWNDRIPYTWNALLQKLDTLCGKNQYTINLLNAIYTLNLETHLGVFGTIDELNVMLDRIIPCNLIIIAKNILYGGNETAAYMGSAISQGFKYVLSSDIESLYSIGSDFYSGGAISEAASYQVSSDMNTTITPSATIAAATIPVVGSHIEIS